MVEEEERVKVEPPPPLGVFIRDYLREHGEGSPSVIHQEYKRTYRGAKTSTGSAYRLGTYRSQLVYIRGLGRAGLVEQTGETERARGAAGEPIREDLEPKVFYRLTRKGEDAPEYVWNHPLRLWYRPFSWEYQTYSEYIKK